MRQFLDEGFLIERVRGASSRAARHARHVRRGKVRCIAVVGHEVRELRETAPLLVATVVGPGRAHLHGNRPSVAVDAGPHDADAHGSGPQAKPPVFLATPHQLHRAPIQRLGHGHGLVVRPVVPVIDAVPPAEEHLVHVHVLGRDAGLPGHAPQDCLRRLGAGPEVHAVGRDDGDGSSRLVTGVIQVRDRVGRLDDLGGPAHAFLKVPELAAEHAGFFEGGKMSLEQRLGADIRMSAVVPLDRHRIERGLRAPPAVGHDRHAAALVPLAARPAEPHRRVDAGHVADRLEVVAPDVPFPDGT